MYINSPGKSFNVACHKFVFLFLYMLTSKQMTVMFFKLIFVFNLLECQAMLDSVL